MTLPNPTIEQSALVSVVTGAMTGAFAVWLGHEKQDVYHDRCRRQTKNPADGG